MRNEYLENLTQRRDYLHLRIGIKKEMGWEYEYDQKQYDALTWALNLILLIEDAD